MTKQSNKSDIVHASCVAVDGVGVLIIGASGSGKSGLALELMALGGMLVSDDRTCLDTVGDVLIATSPPNIKGQIEARGVGILAADVVPSAPIRLVVDMEHREGDRLPEPRTCDLLNVKVPLLLGTGLAHFAAAIIQYLKGGRIDT